MSFRFAPVLRLFAPVALVSFPLFAHAVEEVSSAAQPAAGASAAPEAPAPALTSAATGEETAAEALLGELQAALAEIESSGPSLERLERLGDLYARRGDAQRAVVAFQRAIDEFGGSEQLYVKLSRLLLLAGRPELGMEILKIAQKAYPDSVAILLELGQAYNAFGKHYAAAAILKQAQALDAEDRQVPYHLALALRAQNKLSEASALVDVELEKGTDRMPIYLLKADLLIASGEGREAVRFLEDLFEKNPESPDTKRLLNHAYQTYAAAEAESGRLTRAIRTLEKALELGLNNAAINSSIATLYYEAGDYAAAETQLKGAIAEFPDFLEAYAVYGTVLRALNRDGEAVTMFEEGLKRARAVKDQESVKRFESLVARTRSEAA